MLVVVVVLVIGLERKSGAVTEIRQGDRLLAVPRVEEMRLEEAIAFALEHSPKMKEAQATVRLATLDVADARLFNQVLPTFSFGKRFDTVSPNERFGLAVSLDLSKLFGAGRETERAKLKRFNAEVYAETVKSQVIEEVTRAYFAFQLARQTVAVNKTSLDGQAKLEDVIRIRFEAGKADINDLLGVQSAIAKGSLTLLQAEQDEQLAALHLATVIGLPSAHLTSRMRPMTLSAKAK